MLCMNSYRTLFVNNLVFVLEGSFVHRSRTLEGKDGAVRVGGR
jgi:hypothetical protein